jgi:hypothetical protein
MILDGQLCFTGGTALPNGGPTVAQALTTTADSTNIIDLALGQTNTGGGLPLSAIQTNNAQPFRDLGIGDDPAMKLLVQCATTFSGAGAAVVANFQGAPDSGTGTTGAFTTYYASPSYTVAGGFLVAGARLMDMDVPRPPAGVPEPRFLKLNFAVSGGTFTGSNIFGAIVIDRFDQVYNALVNSTSGGYPAGVTVAN